MIFEILKLSNDDEEVQKQMCQNFTKIKMSKFHQILIKNFHKFVTNFSFLKDAQFGQETMFKNQNWHVKIAKFCVNFWWLLSFLTLVYFDANFDKTDKNFRRFCKIL